MVVAVIRPDNLKVKFKPPTATELKKLQRYDEINHIYIGQPLRQSAGTSPRIQLNDAFADVDDVQRFIAAHPQKYSTTLHVDEEVNMGIISDVKIELRKAKALRIHYATKPRMEEL